MRISYRCVSHRGRNIWTSSLVTFSCMTVFCMTVAVPSWAQPVEKKIEQKSLFPQVSPEDLGFEIPDGDPKPGEGRRVVVPYGSKITVAKVYAEYEKEMVVTLPDGRLRKINKFRASKTSRPFTAATPDEMIAELKKKFKKFKFDTTKRHIYVYNTSENFKTGTARIINTMYPKLLTFCKNINPKADHPQFPLVMLMFRTEEEFHKYRAIPQGVVAYYNVISNIVVMYEEGDLTKHAPKLALKSSIATIAHESVHQTLHNVGVQQRLSRWPMWISEGLPEYFSPTSTGAHSRWKGIGTVNDLRMWELKRELDSMSVNQNRIDVRTAVESKRFKSLEYAKSWSLVHYLAKNEAKTFFEYMRDVSKLKPSKEPPEPGKLFAKHFGTDFDKLEIAVMKHLKKLKYVDPIANQPHFVFQMANGGASRAYVHFSPYFLGKLIEWSKEQGYQYSVNVFPNKTQAERYKKKIGYR